MITMTVSGGFCKVELPLSREFNTEALKMFPQATLEPAPNAYFRTVLVIPDGLQDELYPLITRYYDDNGDPREKANPRPSETFDYAAWRRLYENLFVDGFPGYGCGPTREEIYGVPNGSGYDWDEVVKRASREAGYRRAYGGRTTNSANPYTRVTQPTAPVVTDAHRELGVLPGAHEVVIRAAFRALAGVYHPDKPGGSTQKMQKLNIAFEAVKKSEGIRS